MSISLEEFETIKKYQTLTYLTLSISDFKDQSDRTLLYGYTSSRDTFHLYIKDKKICVYIYGFDGQEIFFSENERHTSLTNLVPDKRAYPESSDPEFLECMFIRGIHIPFTTYNSDRYERVKNLVFHGEIK